MTQAEGSKGIVIQKFGGTSVATQQARSAAIERIEQALREGYQPVVVVSAIGRMGQPYATDTLISLTNEIGPNIARRELDMLMACGELISIAIMAHQIQTELQIPTIALTGGQAGIVTDANFGKAKILQINPAHIHHHLDNGEICVVAGFQGVTEAFGEGINGSITTLGRGGSDTTASALGAALGAANIEIYTDVEGVFTADPSVVKSATPIPEVTYDEVCEMAYQGAKVVHPRAVEIAKRFNVPMTVRSTFSGAPGTRVVAIAPDQMDQVVEDRQVSGIVNSGQVRLIELHFNSLDEKLTPEQVALLASEAELETYRLLGEAGINLYFVAKSGGTIRFVVSNEQIAQLGARFNGMTVPLSSAGYKPVLGLLRCGSKEGRFSTQGAAFAGSGFALLELELRLAERCRIVSVIGPDLQRVPGIIARAAAALAREELPILQTSGSKRAFSMLMSEQASQTALQVLHDEFFNN